MENLPESNDITTFKKWEKDETINHLSKFYSKGKISLQYLFALIPEVVITKEDIFSKIIKKNELLEIILRSELSVDDVRDLNNSIDFDEESTKKINNFLKDKYKTKPDLFNNWTKEDIYFYMFNTDELIIKVKNALKRHNYKEIRDEKGEVYDDIMSLISTVDKKGNNEKLENSIGKDKIYYLKNGILPEIDLNAKGIKMKISNMPELVKNRHQIFVFGSPGSGKTAFLSGLISYALNETKTINDIEYNPIGFEYANLLRAAPRESRLFKSNPEGDFQFFTLDFISKDNKRHPITFYEMAGETYEEKIINVLKTDDGYKKLDKKIKEHIFESKNPKIFFFVIDYQQAENSEILDKNQVNLLANIMANMKKRGVLKSVTSILTLVTKWDLAQKDGIVSVDEYVKKQANTLETLISTAKNDPKRRVNMNLANWNDSFSLGKFEDVELDNGEILENRRYEYIETDSKRLYDWICNNTIFKR